MIKVPACGDFLLNGNGNMNKFRNIPTILLLGAVFLASAVCNAATFPLNHGTMIAIWPVTLLAHITEPGNHYIKADINLKTLRECRANSRTLHQRKPKIYGAIIESHKPWEVYEPYGHLETPVPPKPVKPK